MKDLIDLALSLCKEMHALNEYVRWETRKISERLADEWVDNERVMSILKISKKTLQHMRDKGDLAYSQVKGKLYYRISDVREMLEENYGEKGEGRREKGEGRREDQII